MNVIIIEDEIPAARELQEILRHFDGEIVVLEILYSVSSAISWLKENPSPDLIFSDIQLGDGLSFEIFAQVPVASPVIFCTAYDNYAVEAFEANGIDYLLKPIEESMVEKAVNKFMRVRDYILSGGYSQSFKKMLAQVDQNYRQSILVHHKDQITPVSVADICCAYTANSVAFIQLFDNKQHIVQFKIDQLEELMNPRMFFRVNRQFIVSRRGIESVHHYFNRRLLIAPKCKTTEKIVVSRLKVADFLKWLEN